MSLPLAQIHTIEFNVLRELFLGKGAKLVLLRESDGPFRATFVIATDWHPKFTEFFARSTFRVADLTAETARAIREATHLMVVDSSVAAINNLLFEQDADTQPPLDRGYWNVRATSQNKKIEVELPA